MTDQQKAGEMFAQFAAFILMYVLVPGGILFIVRKLARQKKQMTDPLLQEIQELLSKGASGHITRIQTTFVEFAVEQAAYRVRFEGKREFATKTGVFESLEVLEKHPLLLDYTEPTGVLYFGAPPAYPEAFLTELRTASEAQFGEWRSLKRYLNPQMPPQTLLQTNGGMLLQGPLSLMLRAQSLAETYQMQPDLTRGKVVTLPPQILFLGRHYIIADQFISERLMAGKQP
ncbi:MAG: hypothetical protein V4671_31330 [Armatimonadota bacterium]